MWEKCFYDFQNWYKSKETVRERCTDPGLLFIFRIRRMYFPIFLMVLYLLVLKHWRVFRNGLTVLSVQYLGTLSLVKSSDTASAHLQSLSIFRRSNWTANTFFFSFLVVAETIMPVAKPHISVTFSILLSIAYGSDIVFYTLNLDTYNQLGVWMRNCLWTTFTAVSSMLAFV